MNQRSGILYVDMDNVLVDFRSGIERIEAHLPDWQAVVRYLW